MGSTIDQAMLYAEAKYQLCVTQLIIVKPCHSTEGEGRGGEREGGGEREY